MLHLRVALQAGATWIRAAHIAELRTALGAVYTAHGENEPAYTDPALTAQATLVRAAHVTEIRTAILVVAGVCEPEACSNDGPIDQAIEYYHLDALGSVRAVTDEVGDVVRRHDYFPFGEGVSAIDGYVQRYAEQEGDPESGLSYVGARYYRAWTGRFTTVDPGHVGGNLFNPQSWNGYAYSHNNPATLADPTGLDPTFRVTVVGKLPRTRSGSEERFFWWVFSHLFDSSAMSDHSAGGGRGGGGGRREPSPPTDGGSGGEDGGPGPGGEPPTSPTNPDKPKTRPRQQSSGGQPAIDGGFTSYLAGKPWMLSWIFPFGPVTGLVGAGPAGSVAWDPGTKSLCVGLGAGLAGGHNVAIGPLLSSSGNAHSILSGWSISAGGNLPFPSPMAGVGWQGTAGASGVAHGPAAGAAGISAALTWSSCATLW